MGTNPEIMFWFCYNKHLHNFIFHHNIPASKGCVANMGPTWVLAAPGGPHVGPMKLAIRDAYPEPPCQLKPRSHLADLTADLSLPWWSGEVLWSRREVGKERGWVLEGPERSVNLVEVSPTVPGCFELFKTIGSGRGWRAVVDRALGSRIMSLECR